MEKDDKGSTLIRIGVSGWEFLLVPAYPGCPGSKAVKRSSFVKTACMLCSVNVLFVQLIFSHQWFCTNGQGGKGGNSWAGQTMVGCSHIISLCYYTTDLCNWFLPIEQTVVEVTRLYRGFLQQVWEVIYCQVLLSNSISIGYFAIV